MGIEKMCPRCNKKHKISLTEEELEKYKMYLSGMGKIQDMLPDVGIVEREFLKTGYCNSCQAKIFGSSNKPDMNRWNLC